MKLLFRLSVMAALAAPAPAWAGRIVVRSDVCAALVAHVPDDDVAYEPGIDAYGNPVAPGDLNDIGRIDYNTDDITIAIGNPLIATAGVVGDETAFKAAGGKIDVFGADSSVGSVTLRDGDVLFNGRRITDNQRRALAVACAERQ
jgi:hypothetical protein